MLSHLKQYAKRTAPGQAYLRHRSNLQRYLKQTPLGQAYQRRRLHQHFWQWTETNELAYRFYQQFIQPGDVVFDVGANRGNRAKLFVKLKAFVVMVEPQAACAEYLKIIFSPMAPDKWALVEGALGGAEGEQEMLVSPSDTISTFSTSWLQAVTESGRFDQAVWNKSQKVRMTTLDALIRQYGSPAFIKIDVEGYEREVLSGLSTPPAAVSFEFTPEVMENTFACIDHLTSLADFEFQISLLESMTLAYPHWLSAAAIKAELAKIDKTNSTIFGDVYARKK